MTECQAAQSESERKEAEAEHLRIVAAAAKADQEAADKRSSAAGAAALKLHKEKQAAEKAEALQAFIASVKRRDAEAEQLRLAQAAEKQRQQEKFASLKAELATYGGQVFNDTTHSDAFYKVFAELEAGKGFAKLNESNWLRFKGNMISYLATKNCKDAVTDPASPNSDKAKGYITLCVEDYYHGIIEDAATAHAAWQALEAQFQQASLSNQRALEQELTAMKKKSGESISQYAARGRDVN
ncbi:hypothetical protein OEZ86_004652 [Tetradesmus obliquus]|nr:hypothetical protein OEZ86_004652 [Tetradesmus obliquus]